MRSSFQRQILRENLYETDDDYSYNGKSNPTLAAMNQRKSVYLTIVGYLVLFLLALLVLDSLTLLIGVFVALFALYFFNIRSVRRKMF